MNASRRFEILLPLRFNDGHPVPDEVIGETLKELRLQFGAVTWETRMVRGQWHHEGQMFEDDSMRVVIDVDDRTKRTVRTPPSRWGFPSPRNPARNP